MNATPDTISAMNTALTTLGLQQHPYLDAPDARFFYADPGLIQRLDLLQHLTQFGDMLLCINGPLGSGKTTLAEQYILRGNTHWRCCQLNAAQVQQPSDLVARVAEGFGLRSAAPAERLKIDLTRQFQNIRHNSQLPVLIIDDAQLLPDDVLKMLLELTEQPRETLKLLRIALFGEAGLTQRLTAMGWHSPQQPLLHSMDIPSFNEEQTAAYLMYRLAVAGYSGECPFSLTEIRALHKAAAGLPGKLNALAQETLLEHAGRIATRKTATTPKRLTRPQKMLTLGLIGSVLAAGLAWQFVQDPGSHMDAPQESQVTAELTAPRSVANTAVKPEEPTIQEPAKYLDETSEISQQTEDKIKNNIEPSQASQNSVSSAAQVSPLMSIAEAPAAPMPQAPADSPAAVAAAMAPPNQVVAVPPPTEAMPATSVAPKPAPADPAATAPSATPEATPTPTAPIAVKPAQITVPVPEPVTAQTNTPASSPSIAPKPDATVTAPPTASTADAPTKAAPTLAPKPELLGAEWLQSRPGSRYTLQLLGGRSERSLRDFLRQNPIPEPLAIFRTEFKGADWYVLVHGDYPSFAEARSAIAALPSNVRKGKPWARSFATVHADIKRAHP